MNIKSNNFKILIILTILRLKIYIKFLTIVELTNMSDLIII